MLKRQIIMIILIAAIVLALIVALIFIYAYYKKPQTTPKTPVVEPIEGEHVISENGKIQSVLMFKPGASPEQLKRVTLSGAKDNYSILINLQDVGSGEKELVYYIENGIWAPVEQNTAFSIISSVMSGRFYDRPLDHCSNFIPYGFDTADGISETYYSFETGDGRVQRVYLGALSPDGKGYYARVEREVGSDALYRVSTTLAYYVNSKRTEIVMPILAYPSSGFSDSQYVPRIFTVSNKKGLLVDIAFLSGAETAEVGAIYTSYIKSPALWRGDVSEKYLSFAYENLIVQSIFTGSAVTAIGAHSNIGEGSSDESRMSAEELAKYGIVTNFSYDTWVTLKDELTRLYPKDKNESWSNYYKKMCLTAADIDIADLEYAMRDLHPYDLSGEDGEYYKNETEYNIYINSLIRAYISLADDPDDLPDEYLVLQNPAYSLYYIDYFGAINILFFSEKMTDDDGVNYYYAYNYFFDMVIRVDEVNKSNNTKPLDFLEWEGDVYRRSIIISINNTSIKSIEVVGEDNSANSITKRGGYQLNVKFDIKQHEEMEGTNVNHFFTVSFKTPQGDQIIYSDHLGDSHYSVEADGNEGLVTNFWRMYLTVLLMYDQGALDHVISPSSQELRVLLTIKINYVLDGADKQAVLKLYDYNSPSGTRLAYSVDGGQVYRYVKGSKTEAVIRSVWHVIYGEPVEENDYYGVS